MVAFQFSSEYLQVLVPNLKESRNGICCSCFTCSNSETGPGSRSYSQSFGDKNNTAFLHENIMRLLKLLEDFPEKHSPNVRPYEKNIRDAAYKLEDLIDRCITLSGTVLPVLRDPEKRSSFTHILDTHIQGVNSLTKYVDSILEVATKAKNINTTEDLSRSTRTASSAFGSSRNAPSLKETMIGVTNDLIQIKDRVTGYELNLQIVPIIGTGGIGKTTLARNVFKDSLIEQHFDVRFWVTVSQKYRVQDILQDLLPEQEPTEKHVEMLIECVYKSLKNRRYLIVLDDIWHGDVWDRIRRALPDDNNGSRVIITTRLSDVAAAIDSSASLHHMQFLDEDQSWALLRKNVFGQEDCPRHLENIGKIIAGNCKGLPLTVVVISGLLKVNKTKDYWDSVAKNIKEVIATNDDEFFAILSLSYDNLPHHLKACFLYMGIFPEDYSIPINKLIKLWVAEGFLRRARSKSSEEVGEESLEDLVNRNLVLVTKKRSNGRIRFCRIHDVMRELSIKKAHEEKFNQHYKHGYSDKYNIPEIPNMQRRLIIHTTCLDSLPYGIHISGVRSLLFFSLDLDRTHLLSFTSLFLLLRVVDGLDIESKCLPDDILNLVHLRYLAFTCNSFIFFCFPTAISKLKNLETLIINKKDGSNVLGCKLVMPSEIWKMSQLRHLVLNILSFLPIPDSEELGESYSILHNLQTLHVTDLEFTKEVIERLPNLKKLRVKYRWPRAEHCVPQCINNLVYLHQLEELNFEIEVTLFEPNIPSFPRNLKKLTLRGCKIPWEKMSIVGSLPNLEVLKLMSESFLGREWEVTEDFSSLKHLEMECIDLEDWIVESNNFPRLERLIIRMCKKLKEVPESIGDIATLQMLTVEICNASVKESLKRIQEQQQSLDNNDLKVRY